MLRKIFITFLLLTQITGVYAARNLPTQEPKTCVKKEVSAENLKTKEIKTFPSSCEIPEGWVIIGKSGFSTNSENKKATTQSNLIKIQIPESNDARSIQIITQDYSLSLSNATYWEKAVKKSTKKTTQIYTLSSKESWEIFLNIAEKKSKTKNIYIKVTQNKKSVTFLYNGKNETQNFFKKWYGNFGVSKMD